MVFIGTLVDCHALLRLGLFLNADGHLGHPQKFRRRVLLEYWLEDLLLMGQVDQHADFPSAVAHLALSEQGHRLHVAGPGLRLLEHLLRKIEHRAGYAGWDPLVHFDLDEAQFAEVAGEHEHLLSAFGQVMVSLEEPIDGRESDFKV